MLKKSTLFWREAHVEVKMQKAHHVRCSTVVSCGRRKGFCTFTKFKNTGGFRSICGSGGTFEEDVQRCISHGRCGTRDTSIRLVGRSGH